MKINYSDYDVEPFPEDEDEFRNGFHAKKYYKLAYTYGKTAKFKALCLRLATDYKNLKAKYPDDYDRLAGNCAFFGEYFQSGRESK